MVGSGDTDNSDDQIPFPFASHRRKRVESQSPVSPVVLPPSLSPSPPPRSEKPAYYTIVGVRPRTFGVRRLAPHQREIAKTPWAIYSRKVLTGPTDGPSHPTTRVGPPKRRLPIRPEPKLRPAEPHPPRPPPPAPGLTALEARMEARMNALADENQKLRDELFSVKGELATSKDDLSTALARIGAVEHNLHDLEALDPKFEDMKENYERLANLLKGEHLFDSEKFRSAIQAEVKGSIGYYWPSVKSDLRAQLWREFPEPAKKFVEKEIGKVVEDVAVIRSNLVALQQHSSTSGNAESSNPAIAELKQALERVEKRQGELEVAVSEVGSAQQFERARRASTSSVPRPAPNHTGTSA